MFIFADALTISSDQPSAPVNEEKHLQSSGRGNFTALGDKAHTDWCHTDYLLPGGMGCLATPDNEYQEHIEE